MGSHVSPFGYAVRRFESRDVPAIEAIAKGSPGSARWSRESYAELSEQGGLIFVAEAAGTLVGFLATRVTSGEAEILNLAVSPANRRAGIATALFRQALAEFRRRQATQIFAEVRESNAGALQFYEKHGFVRTGRRPGYYQQPAEAAVLLRRELTD
jgi:[ribosomal protein S18]-alanine N-acetyltransferase